LVASLAEASGEGPELPDPAILWRKARLLEAIEARRNAIRPVHLAHSISLGAAASLLIVLAGSKGASLLAWIERWAGRSSGAAPAGLTLPLILSLFALGAVLLLATGAAAGRYAQRRSDSG
jgi:hypothetical protein